MQGTDGDLHLYAHSQLAYLRLVDVASEDEVVHVGNSSDRGTVVEGIRIDNRVTDLNGNVKDNATDGRTDER